MRCKNCGSYAINHKNHGRDGSDGDLCDVCYWRTRAERLRAEVGGTDDISQSLIDENERLRAAITQTLNENGHLADGDNCTLILLKRALPDWAI